MEKESVWHKFQSSFGWKAYDERNIPDDAAGQVVECIVPFGDEQLAHLPLFLAESDIVAFSSAISPEEESGSFITAFGYREHNEDSWDITSFNYSKDENLKPTYEFGFTATPDGQGGFTATPDTGVTYDAIRAALTETPFVFAKVAFGNGHIVARFNEIGSNAINASIIVFVDLGAGVHFYAMRLRMDTNNQPDIAADQIGS